MEVTNSVTAISNDLHFVEVFVGCEKFEKAGAPLAEDGDTTVVTPYANCLLIMPNHRLKGGQRAARFARILD